MKNTALLKDQYQSYVQQEKTLLRKLAQCLLRAGAPQTDFDHVQQALERLDELFLLVIVGEFNSGKSAFVNALLGQKVLEEGPVPTTDLITMLKYGEQPDTHILDQLRVTKFPLDLLKHVNIVDTPGTNSLVKEHDELTLNFIPRADFVMFILSADRPFSDSEREFLELISLKWKRKVLFLLNKIDTKSAPDIEAILKYIRLEGLRILGFEPLIFPLSVAQAFEAKTTHNASLLRQSRFDDVERYLFDALNEDERVRLKLLNPIYTVQPICQTAKDDLTNKLAVIGEDMQRLKHLEKQLAYTHDDLKEHSARFLLKMENVLLELRNRAYDFVDDFLQLRNVWDIASKEKAETLFNQMVVKDSSQQIEDVLTASADWLVKKSMKAWDDTLEYYNAQFNHDVYHGKTLGTVGGQFAYDREKIYQGVIRQARDNIKAFDYQQESRNILKTFQNAMIHFAATEVGAIGIGTILVAVLSGIFLDITGIVAAGTLVTAGFFILPRKRRQAKEAFNQRIQELIDDLKQNVAREFDEYMQITFEQIKETINPVDRFCRAEHDELSAASGELDALLQQLHTLQREIVAQTGS